MVIMSGMHVAIVGAGFAGLALSFYLLQKNVRVTLFDEKPIGSGGASNIAAGLIHPYPGEKARRSAFADQAMLVTEELLRVSENALGAPVSNRSGIIRYALDEEQQKRLIESISQFNDIERIGEHHFFIRSGSTVYPTRYIQGLYKACEARGVSFCQHKITSPAELHSFDQVVLSCGEGVFSLASSLENIPLKRIKGQVLQCKMPQGVLQKSMIGKGYIALSETPHICYVGATFEREFIDGLPHLEEAKAALFPKVARFFPEVEGFEVLDCKAAVRVAQPGSYLPLVKKIEDKIWVFGALGSRGLLYHAFFAKQLSRLLLK